jgi:hypothetical protein
LQVNLTISLDCINLEGYGWDERKEVPQVLDTTLMPIPSTAGFVILAAVTIVSAIALLVASVAQRAGRPRWRPPSFRNAA